MTEQQSTTDS